MTELEALAKDCIENHTHKLVDKPTKQDIYTREESIYISGYRECERRNVYRIAKANQIIRKLIALHFAPIVTNKDVENANKIIAEAKDFVKKEITK